MLNIWNNQNNFEKKIRKLRTALLQDLLFNYKNQDSVICGSWYIYQQDGLQKYNQMYRLAELSQKENYFQ